jgi:hypothetical protein
MDRWATYASTGTIAVTQSTDAPAGFANSFLWTTTTGGSRASGDYYEFVQFIEGYNIADLSWGTSSAKPITISFWTKSSVTGVFGVLFRNSAANRNYVTTYTINSANTWEQKSITLAGCTDGTWQTTTSKGIEVWFDLGSGSTYQTSTLNSWISGSGSSLTSTTQAAVGSVTGATLYITGVQLEAGTTASPFEYRQYGTELALCQRYYYQDVGTNAVYCECYSASGSYPTINISNPVVMRVKPTIGLINYPSGYVLSNCTSLQVNGGTAGVSYFAATSSGTGRNYFQSQPTGGWYATAEL